MCCMWLAGNAGPKKSPKIRRLGIIAQICRAISSQLRHLSTIGQNLLNSNISPTCPYNMVNFGPLASEIVSLVWGTPANVNGFCVFAALLHGTLVVGVCQTLRRWTEGATYTRQGGHHVGHWPTFLVDFLSVFLLCVFTVAVSLGSYFWKSCISVPTKVKLYNTCILPIFLYGSECWTVTKVDACRIDALDQWCLRTLLGIKWHQSFFFILSTSLLILYFENIPTPFPG